MSTHVVAIRPPDERWQKMKAAYDALTAAGLAIPAEVWDFFDGRPPDPVGVVLPLEAGRDASVREWRTESAQGVEVMVSLLPPEVGVVRFYNSW